MVNYLVVKDKNYFSSFLDQAMVIADRGRHPE